MAEQGSGYGGGGAGGGEKSSDSFTGSSSGKPGIVYIMTVYTSKLAVIPNIKADVNGSIMDILSYGRPTWATSVVTPEYKLSKLTLSLPFTSRPEPDTRYLKYGKSDAVNIFNNSDAGTSESGTYYGECNSLLGFKSSFGLKISKMMHENRAFKALYSTSSGSLTYFSSISTTSYEYTTTVGEMPYTFGLSSGTDYFFILQAGGGGGGGADNSWGLFNYAAGGGGGGGGGGRCVHIKTNDYCQCKIVVGYGGSGGSSGNGSRPSGSSGGDTYIQIYGRSGFNEFNTKIGEVRVTGGKGGEGADGDSAGGGGENGAASEIQDDKGFITSICIVDGGKGGSVGGGKGVNGVSGDKSKTLSLSLFDVTITADTSSGSGGGVNSENDRGGGGGASWLGNGGYY